MKRDRKTMWLVLGFLLLASLTLVAFMMQPTAADLLTQALETTQTITDGHAVLELQIDISEQSETATVEVWGRLGGDSDKRPAFGIEVLEASLDETTGVIAVSDGSQFWIWHPSGNTVYTATADEVETLLRETLADREIEYAPHGEHERGEFPETAEEAVAKLLQYLTAERTGTENVGDATAYKSRLVPIPEQMPDEIRAAGGFLNIWIAAESNAPLAVEYAEGAVGYGKVAATFLEFNQGIDDSLFRFDIPEGAEIVRLVDVAEAMLAETAVPADFQTLSPTELPEGASPVGTSSLRGAIVQRFSLPDGKSFSVAQGPAEISYQPDSAGTPVTIRGAAGSHFAGEGSRRTLLAWTEGDVSFWVGGDLTAEEAFAVAESLR